MSSSKHLSLFFYFFFLLYSSASALNITDILSKYPEFSTFSNLLVQTKVGDTINSRQSITVLVVNNDAFSSLSGESDNVVKNILSLHVILDYFDQQKLQKLDKKTALLTTLFQSSGQAKGQQGFLNVTNLSDGSIAFGSAVPGAELKSKFEKAVTSQPYNISILQVSSVIAPPGMAGNSNSNSSSNSNSTTEKQSSNSPSPAGSPTKTPAPGANPAKPPANNATPASPNPAKKESPENSPKKAPTPSDAGKSPEKAPTPSNSKASTPSTADSPDTSSPTSAKEPAAAKTPTSPMVSPPEPGSAPGPVAGDASGPAADSQSAGSLAAPIDGLKAGALAVIFAWSWSLF